MNQAQFQLAFLVTVIGLGLAAAASRRHSLFYLALGVLVIIPWLDDAFVAYDDQAILRSALDLPEDVAIGRANHGKTPACWAAGRRIATTLTFPDPARRTAFISAPIAAPPLQREVSRFLVRPTGAIDQQALQWQRVAVRYSRDGAGREWSVEQGEFLPGFVCAGFYGQSAKGPLAIRRCDPLDTRSLEGAEGSLILTHPDSSRQVDVVLRFASNGPQCRNRIRHFVNRAFGLADPD